MSILHPANNADVAYPSISINFKLKRCNPKY